MRVQWRVRTLMLLVAGLALALGLVLGVVAERRRDYYRLRVEALAWGEADLVERIAVLLREARQAEARGPDGRVAADAARAEAESLAEIAAWHVKMERKYMRAVEDPWGPLLPDPPPPRSVGPGVTGRRPR